MSSLRNADFRRTVTGIRLVAAVCALALLSGCGGAHSDLEEFVAEVKARPGGRIAPMPEFKTYETFAYSASEKRDPFSPIAAIADNEPQDDNGVRPDQHRHREALEEFPLDTLKFAGHLEKDGLRWAILTAPDGLVHRVQVGNYLGQNYGRIIDISEARIEIVEIIPNGLGGWIERQASLALPEE